MFRIHDLLLEYGHLSITNSHVLKLRTANGKKDEKCKWMHLKFFPDILNGTQITQGDGLSFLRGNLVAKLNILVRWE